MQAGNFNSTFHIFTSMSICFTRHENWPETLGQLLRGPRRFPRQLRAKYGIGQTLARLDHKPTDGRSKEQGWEKLEQRWKHGNAFMNNQHAELYQDGKTKDDFCTTFEWYGIWDAS
jgi:hypothetical protein